MYFNTVYVISLGTISVLIVCQFATMHDVRDAIFEQQESLKVISTVSEVINENINGDLTDDASLSAVDESNPYEVGANDGVFFSNVSYDFRECASPERHVPWPLEGDIRSKTSDTLTCGMKSDTSAFFRGSLWEKNFAPLTSKCKILAVFGVAFGGNFVKDLDAPHVRSLVNATDLLGRHGNCFFILTTKQDIERNDNIVKKYNSEERSLVDPVMIGHNILIPLPTEILPYRNPRRNVKLLKYMGQYMFPETETVIWQDAKFFREDFVSKQPMDYGDMVEHNACVTFMGLPIHKNAFGLENIRMGIQKYGRYTAQYEHHCQTIIAALIDRPNVTDSSDNLIRQCDAYLQHVYQQEGTIESMNQGLIDSAFIIWNHKTQACRDFSSTFRCTIMDQIHCHSDRDQVSIPFAMYNMGVSGRYRQHTGDTLKKLDEKLDPRIHDLDFVVSDTPKSSHASEMTSNNEATMLRITRSSCHWYFSRLGNCQTDLTEEKPTVALLVAGSAN